MNQFDFISNQLDLIEIEKNAEVDESKDLFATSSLQRLQLKGKCLLKLKINSKSTGLYGRTIIVLQTAVYGKVINTQHFSSGDIVSISENGIPLADLMNESKILSGTVTKVTPQSVSIAIDCDLENLDDLLNDDDVYKIIKLSNEITYKRIKKALLRVKNSNLSTRSSHMADVLFLNSVPDQSEMKEDTNKNQTFFNKGLDNSQQEAVRFTFEQKDLAIIHGPPGTGKTTTLVEIIKQNCLKYKQKILCCAPSNIAVDNLVERLIEPEIGYSKLKMIRLGHPARLLESIQSHSLDSIVNHSEQFQLVRDIKNEMETTLKAIRKSSTERSERKNLKTEMGELRKELYKRENKAIKEVLQSAECILATLTTCHDDGPLKHLQDDHFDIIIIDECSQALEAACWIPLVKGARKLIIAGDHLQLPPTIISKDAAQKGLEKTLMKRLIDALGERSTRMLSIQYRMNALIMNWISEKLYDSKLIAHESVSRHLLSDIKGVEKDEITEYPLLLIDTDGCDMPEMIAASEDSNGDEESKANDGEANIVCQHVTELIKKNIREENIAVITPYNLQMELIKAKLHTRYPNVEVKSVDGFQGREKEAVILSMVRSNTRGEVGFLADERRINVAITRARRHLCVVCDRQTLKSNDFLKSFLDYCEKYGEVKSGFEYINNEEESENIDRSEFENIKFQKLKISNKKKTYSVDKNKEQKNYTLSIKSKLREPVKIVTPEEINFEQSIEKIIETLKSNTNQLHTHAFSAELGPRERRIVHEVAEKHGINHFSYGEGNQRYIVISTEVNTEKNYPIKLTESQASERCVPKSGCFEPENDINDNVTTSKRFEALQDQKNECSQQSKSQKKKNKNLNSNLPVKKIAGGNLLGELEDQDDSQNKFRDDVVKCSHCEKFILKLSFLMHELHCAKINGSIQKKEIHTEKKLKEPATTVKVSASSKIKSNPVITAKTDDFDELLDMFQKSNDTCCFKGCKVLTKTLGQNCDFCPNRFCLKHSLAEIHGCGEEAKKQARAHIRKEGNLDMGKKQSYSADLKHKIVQKKLHEKIASMQEARTGAKKKDK